MNQPITFIIFGGTGDLVKQKIGPTLAQLSYNQQFSGTLVGIARGDFTDQTYKQLLIDSCKTLEQKIGIEKLSVRFFRADATIPHALDPLPLFLKNHPQTKIWYLSVGYVLFKPIIENLIRASCVGKNDKVVCEKPFGHDVKSARQIDAILTSVFTQEQIYRIDHYLGKDIVRQLTSLRFSNTLFQHLSNKTISSIHILAHETVGVADRLNYYETSNATKDMIQSHLLQIASLVLMPKPSSLSHQDIHTGKEFALAKLSLANSGHLLGQYQTYAQELDLAKKPYSRTHTYAKLVFESSDSQWKGVPIMLETGKQLPEKQTRIVLTYKNSDLYEHAPSNKLIIDIHNSTISLFFNTAQSYQKPQEHSLVLVQEQSHDGYLCLFEELLRSNRTQFVTSKQIELSWSILSRVNFEILPFSIYPNKSLPFLEQKSTKKNQSSYKIQSSSVDTQSTKIKTINIKKSKKQR
jgi:glucose-6-phosphate 1-dehydrogenase